MAEIEAATGVKATLIPGSKGIFDVKKDGVLIYSKYETDRHVSPGELAALLTNG